VADDLGEKTEKPTAKRLNDARSRGNLPKSNDLSSAVMLLCGLLIFRFLGESMFDEMGTMLERSLSNETIGDPRTLGAIPGHASTLLAASLRIAALPMLLIVIAAYAANFMQVGWLFSLKTLQFNPGAMNPAKGFKRIFGKRGGMKSFTDISKFIAVAIVVVLVVRGSIHKIAVLPQFAATQAFLIITDMLYDLAIKVAIVLLILGIIDWIYQKWQHVQDLKMSKSEVKEERKAADGDPKIKQRRFKLAQEIYMQRLGIDVPKADVVVTNPTHFAVALQYDAEAMSAPKVVAKGADLMAMRIRQIAVANGVPIVERPPLARVLYRQVDVGEEVPPAQYEAVAEVLAYVYRMEGRAAG
jgi:flagellar biosynthetic protein FlhB